MRADTQDQLRIHPVKKRAPLGTLLLALGVIVGLGAFWFYGEDSALPGGTVAQTPAATSKTEPGPAAGSTLPPTPDIPHRADSALGKAADGEPGAGATPSSQAAGPATEPLTTAQGEDLLREQLALASPESGLDILAGTEHPLEATAALADGLGRGLILRKILPTSPPQPGFQVQQAGDVIYMNPANYERFSGIADNVSSLDTATLVDAFHNLRPLYEGAYSKLGLDPDDFDNALIRTLDLVLATPEITEPIVLKTRAVAYVYADPALESLPPVQKQLLRMGPDNIRLIKKQAQALRDELLAREE